MIDVEIRGPVAKKEYQKLKTALMSGEGAHMEKRATVIFSGIEAGMLADLEIDYSPSGAKVVLKDRRYDRETVLKIAEGELKDLLAFAAGIGYVRGDAYVREVLVSRYGGATISLVDPLEDEGYYYEASITAHDPVSAKEAKAKLETLARTFKLPLWSGPEMQSFFVSLKKRVNYQYDYMKHGAEHFKEKYGI